MPRLDGQSLDEPVVDMENEYCHDFVPGCKCKLVDAYHDADTPLLALLNRLENMLVRDEIEDADDDLPEGYWCFACGGPECIAEDDVPMCIECDTEIEE